jgi:hypothetical protein
MKTNQWRIAHRSSETGKQGGGLFIFTEQAAKALATFCQQESTGIMHHWAEELELDDHDVHIMLKNDSMGG